MLQKLFGDTQQLNRFERVALHVLILHAVGGFELIKSWF